MISAVQKSEPPSRNSRFLVGRDAQGCWVVRDRKGLVGGLFTDRAAAVHFAMVESDRVPGAVSCAPDDAIVSLGPVFDHPSRLRRASRH
ncbi:hypothetical protein [Mesorhizobium sp. IMUNJ 23232]|uniref:hypothetical protein n=1 Tax=Mesorhizobium sp. IMUNJ 23232 TaxID=3376064 RepID=UPI00378F6B79